MSPWNFFSRLGRPLPLRRGRLAKQKLAFRSLFMHFAFVFPLCRPGTFFRGYRPGGGAAWRPPPLGFFFVTPFLLGYRRSAGRPAVPPSIRDLVGWPAGFLRRRLAAAALTHRTAYEIRGGFPDWFLGGWNISDLGLSVSGWLDLRLSDAGLCLFVSRTGRGRRRLANRWAGSSLSCAGSVGGWPTDSEVAPQTRRSPGSSAFSRSATGGPERP